MEYKYKMKPLFEERMKLLLPDEKDFNNFSEIIHKEPPISIRCNTLKISPERLKKKLEDKGWKIQVPFAEYKEIMIIQSELQPGGLGKSIEHLLGYYYVQEISSMLSILALKPQPHESLLDLCASPGSKTTQAAAMMQNSGFILANDKDLGRIIILNSNLERMSVTNQIVTKREGENLCNQLNKQEMKFDKILLDAPCSGEGTCRSSPKTFLMWNPGMIKKLSRTQKRLASSVMKLLKPGGELLYSTCTHAPEENEEVVQMLIDNFPLEIKEINLPLKTRPGLTEWQGQSFSQEMKKTCRIYPQDNDTEGFFLAKMRLKK